jgi:RNA polymerase sigma factor (sigma-70 family)
MADDEKKIAELSDDELCARCREGIELAERELLGRYMPAIYWLPHRLLGVPEEELAGFLLFAMEKIRERDLLAQFAPERGAKFSTWFSVVIRNLYIDYLRAQPDKDPVISREPEEIDDRFAASETQREERSALLEKMQIKCRVTFKLLLADTFQLTGDDLAFLAQESGRSLTDAAQEVARLEERLRSEDERIAKRYDQLARAYYWKNFYARQVAQLEKQTPLPHTTAAGPRLEKMRRLQQRRQQEYDTLTFELSGIGGIVTTPYKELARLFKTPEGTLASNISRCRVGAADILRRLRAK